MNGKQKFVACLVAFQFLLVIVVFLTVNGLVGLAGAQEQQAANSSNALVYAVSGSLAIAICGLGAANAVKTTGTAAISTLGERESAFFKAFLVVALAEAIAIYGLIFAILMWQKLP